MTLDTSIFYAINHFARHTPWLQPIVAAYANYGTVLFVVLIVAGWWIARKQDSVRMAAAVWAPLGVLAVLALNQPIADAVGEVRPCNALHDIVVLHCNTDPGFPSDHAVMAGAATVGVWLVHRRLGVLALLASVVLCFARVYVGAHYPQDVLAGFVLGALVGLVGYVLVRRPLTWLIDVVAGSPLRPLVAQSRG
ncbi:phosphatase PAP2 family protein [Mycolicibacterium sp. P1-5]|uniref:phosphatase PAP2 family protein n=1 Tax=Mycolicibacterium sp. P1-5 TaxID=2024617 RepID=UPI0011EE7855|nr:phosphatase PAP2 family protein [Mycolicibacterium sp. P1-5]KAA0111105.1 phosphatase PAP2 family protein [Mycolicibacterium sp. P1-5]